MLRASNQRQEQEEEEGLIYNVESRSSLPLPYASSTTWIPGGDAKNPKHNPALFYPTRHRTKHTRANKQTDRKTYRQIHTGDALKEKMIGGL